jgi:tRNA(Ile)-lysidine synthase
MAGSRKSPPAELSAAGLEAEVGEIVARETRRGWRITAGLSGGLDSIVLTEILHRIGDRVGFALDAIHVNHGISPNAAQWEDFAHRYCRRRGIPLHTVRVAVGREGGLENAAREARYAAFVSHETDVVALAHHSDDQAETVLLQLLRGAGVRGLSAMPVLREERRTSASGAVLLLRPLLNFDRTVIEAYARLRRLRWVEDESNADLRLARNFLRSSVLPVLEKRFPGSRRTLARSAGHLAEAARLLDELAAIDARRAVVGDRLQVAGLRALGGERARNVLRHFLSERRMPIPAAIRLEEGVRQFLAAGQGGSPVMEWAGVALRRYRGWIELVEPSRRHVAQRVVSWEGQDCMELPWGGGRLEVLRGGSCGLAVAALDRGPVTIRCRTGGERIRLRPGHPSRTLKNLLQEAGVPPWRREVMPLVYCGADLVWVPGVGTAAEYVAGAGEPALVFSWEAP